MAKKKKTTAESPEVTAAKVKALENVTKAQQEKITELETREPATPPAPAAEAAKGIPTDTFTVNGKKYQFKFGRFNIKTTPRNRQTFAAADCLQRQELLDLIVEKYPSLVTEVN